MWIGLEQCAHCHDHARLAVAALRDLMVDPGLLNRGKSALAKRFDRRDLSPDDGTDGSDATALDVAIDMHGACAALGNAAAEFRSGQSNFIADDPQERSIRFDVEVVDLAVDFQLNRHQYLPDP